MNDGSMPGDILLTAHFSVIAPGTSISPILKKAEEITAGGQGQRQVAASQASCCVRQPVEEDSPS